MNRNTQSTDNIAQVAENRWNAGADEYNQWDALGQDEKDQLITAEQTRVASPENDAGNVTPE
jgi:hypothetical protein